MEYRQQLEKAARAGGEVLRHYFGQTLEVVEKSTHFDLRTKADLESEAAILDCLRSDFPHFNIFSEEEGKTEKGSDYTLVVDPLDGTNNFVLNLPAFTVSIGLVKDKNPVAGVIYMPITGQVFYAEKDKGAFLNKKLLSVSSESDISRSTIGYGCGYSTDRFYVAEVIGKLKAEKYKRLLLNWCPTFDYCLLANGLIEGIVSDHLADFYDYAAGKLIALEAGACISNLDGSEATDYSSDAFILANSPSLKDRLVDTIRQ